MGCDWISYPTVPMILILSGCLAVVPGGIPARALGTCVG